MGWGVKAGMVRVWVAGKTVIVTHGPYLNALEVIHNKALYEFKFTLLYFTLPCGTR